jgi:exonuclease SbcD
LLKALDIHVIGNCSDDPADEVLLLRDAQGIVELIICAVPYLRDRDIRMVEAGESLEDKERKLIQGIRSHYTRVAALAEQQRESLGADIPIIAMGHLFTSGGQTLDGDGVRELYVGSLAHVRADIFPKCLDYVALGHLHIPQEVGGSRTIRYSGSPIAMGFGEARQQKSLCQIDFQGRTPEVQLIEIPVFQRLERIKGDWNLISDHIQALSAQSTSCWLEVIYEGTEIIGDLRERLEALTAGSQLETLRIENRRLMDLVLHQAHAEETLKDLNELEVFERCLAAHEIAEDQRPELLGSYRETLRSLQEADLQAE